MCEFTTWIDKSFQEVLLKISFLRYFSNMELENVEDTYFLSNKLKGIDLTFTEDLIVKSIHLSSGKYLDDNEFKEELPLDLKFGYNRMMVIKLIGLPNTSGGGFSNPVIGFVNKWDKYFFNSYSIHLQYSKNAEYIELITIGSLRFE